MFEEYLKKAEEGDAQAQYNLADCYCFGDGTEVDLKKYLYWLTKAAEGGYPDAQTDLADCYFWGDGVKKDLDKAIYWNKKSADQGNVQAMYALGKYYYNDKDLEQAKEWFKKAAVKGMGKAQFMMAKFEDPFYWYNKSVKAKYGPAFSKVAECYLHGIGTKQDIELAIEWYNKAVAIGDQNAIIKVKEIKDKYHIE